LELREGTVIRHGRRVAFFVMIKPNYQLIAVTTAIGAAFVVIVFLCLVLYATRKGGK